MLDGTNKLFDLNGDGRLDGIEIALAYCVVFGDDEKQGSDDLDPDSDRDEQEE